MTIRNSDFIVALPGLRVGGANACSGPLTHGFPAMTAFLGLADAIERRQRNAGAGLRIDGVGVVCHGYQENVYLRGGQRRFALRSATPKPNGSAASVVTKGSIDLDLTLVLGVTADSWLDDGTVQNAGAEALREAVLDSRLAGGSFDASVRRLAPTVMSLGGCLPGSGDAKPFMRRLAQRLRPGKTLVLRRDLLAARDDHPGESLLESWLAMSGQAARWRPGQDSANGEWTTAPNKRGWIVPIPIGYAAVSLLYAPGELAGVRDATVPLRFVECVYSLGQWIAPGELSAVQSMLWYRDADADGHYLCGNDYINPTEDAEEIVA